MYARQPPTGKFSRPFQLPSNYSGNAFAAEEVTEVPSVPEEEKEAEEIPTSAPPQQESEPAEKTASPAGKLFSSPGFHLDLGRLFKSDRGGGIGMEELLLIGLIFLISQGETKDDLLLLLLLLLFIQ
ncbi:MAG: hypothetical protein IJY47_04105 [Clostridia bacterium]|nr:hypothetical protein [Clostridia bacterium]